MLDQLAMAAKHPGDSDASPRPLFFPKHAQSSISMVSLRYPEKNPSILTRALYIYCYNSPIGVMTTGEAVVFTLVLFATFVLLIYGPALLLVPDWMFRAAKLVASGALENAAIIGAALPLMWSGKQLPSSRVSQKSDKILSSAASRHIRSPVQWGE